MVIDRQIISKEGTGMHPGYSVIEKDYMESIVVQKGDYPYFVNSVSNGSPALTKDVLDAVTDCILSISDLDCDLLLAPEAMGIQYCAALTIRTGRPFQVIRKRGLGIEGEIVFDKTTGYEGSTMYLDFVKKGTKVIIVDAVISTGGTLRAIVKALRDNGIIVEEVITVLNKSPDIGSLAKELDLKIKGILNVGIVGGRPVCSPFSYE